MSEKELAANVARLHAKGIVDNLGGATLGGSTIADRYQALWSAAGYDVSASADALRHWVECAGYDDNGEFEVKISDTFLNG